MDYVKKPTIKSNTEQQVEEQEAQGYEVKEQAVREQLQASLEKTAASGEAVANNMTSETGQRARERDALLNDSEQDPIPHEDKKTNAFERNAYVKKDEMIVGSFGSLRGKSAKSGESPRSGEIVAGMLSALLGMAALTASHWWSAADPAHANLFLIRLSSWLPGGLRIGPYGGKELIALAVWLGSWLILFLTLQWFELRVKPWVYVFSIAIVVMLVLLWPPVYHRIYGWPA